MWRLNEERREGQTGQGPSREEQRMTPVWYASLFRLEKRLRSALPGHCAFCLGQTLEEKAWCQECFDRLPWNKRCCTRCAEPLTSVRQVLCTHCRSELPAFSGAHVPFIFEGPIRQLVHNFKFEASPRAGHLMVDLYLETLTGDRESRSENEVLLPVPLFAGRSQERGFNQADWFARQLGRHLDLPVINATRLVDTPSQRMLGRQGRRDNLNDVFQLHLPSASRVVIVDDVVTTGATAQSLARTALAAGAMNVAVLAFARTPLGA